MKVHVVCTTHWDREWYLSAERFRFRLVQTIDAVLELLQQYPFYTFTLDGQSIVLEDYLEIRPEREAKIRTFLQSGRLRAGPWYVQPDEFLVSAEALRRNLELGSALVRSLGGEPVKVGYLPDAFGHLANLPAILQSTGIDSTIFTRGIGQEVQALGDLFEWQSPDGQKVLAHRQPIGYGMTLANDLSAAKQQLQVALEKLEAEARSPELLLQLGSDHSRPQSSVPTLIEQMGQPFGFSDHEAYIKAIQAARPKLQSYKGELRSGEVHPLLSGTLSARQYLKLRNYALDDRLRFSTEKLLELAQPYGTAPSPAYLNRAWKLLIRNHPHDSICGCSVDSVHDEMEVRFQQAEDIALELETDALSRLTQSPYAGKLLVLNPYGAVNLQAELSLARHELENIEIGGQAAQVLHSESQQVSTLAGPVSSLPEWLEQLDDRHPIRAMRWQIEGTHLQAEIDEGPRHPDCPPSELLLREAIENKVQTVELQVYHSRATLAMELARGECIEALELGFAASTLVEPSSTLRNAFLEVSIEPQGTLQVKELESGRVWSGLHALVDCGDKGDTYTFSATSESPLAAKLVSSKIVQQGLACSVLELHYQLTLPVSLSAERDKRSLEMTTIPITTQVTLWNQAKHLEFKTHFINTAQDHRLRVLFPAVETGSYADSAEAIVQRPELLPSPDTAHWAEQPADAHPLAHWVAKQTPVGYWGLASRGLSEYGHIGGLSLTLVRAVNWLSRDDLPERPSQAGPPYSVLGAQCLGLIGVQYAWFPTTALDDFQTKAMAYAHPARGWLAPAK